MVRRLPEDRCTLALTGSASSGLTNHFDDLPSIDSVKGRLADGDFTPGDRIDQRGIQRSHSLGACLLQLSYARQCLRARFAPTHWELPRQGREGFFGVRLRCEAHDS